jgi:hypothetical protein
MTSAWSRWSQSPKAAISNWNGSTLGSLRHCRRSTYGTVRALSEAIEDSLIAQRIFDVDGYGWLNADEHDPDFVGYAMWATSPPFETDFESAFAGKPPRCAATQREQRLVELGTDFEGLMKAARYAIGSVLIHRGTLSPNDFQPSAFEFHEINALVTLSMASDRARDFVVLAVIEETPRANHELDQYRLALCCSRSSHPNSMASSICTGITPTLYGRDDSAQFSDSTRSSAGTGAASMCIGPGKADTASGVRVCRRMCAP